MLQRVVLIAIAAVAVVVPTLGCGGASTVGDPNGTTDAATPAASTSADDSLDRHAAEVVRCHEPDEGIYGFFPGRCAEIEESERIRENFWRLQLRRGEIVYCVDLHLGEYVGDGNLDVDDVGSMSEVKCPASAYGRLPAADLEVAFKGVVDEPGVAMLSAIGSTQTHIVVDANADRAWIRRGTCAEDSHAAKNKLDLNHFYSYRSITTLVVSLETLTDATWVIEWDYGGAHGGDPLACAALGVKGHDGGIGRASYFNKHLPRSTFVDHLGGGRSPFLSASPSESPRALPISARHHRAERTASRPH